ncbi:MAG: hypothetical protein K2P74_10935 [Nitrosomonas sp.]|nr:hypothetical protein [Nitrosomonas sp.]
MIGIHEEKLKELLSGFDPKISSEGIKDNKIYQAASKYVLESLLATCEELNCWIPIEQAPQDRRILLFYPTFGQVTGQWNEELGWKPDQQLIPNDISPTHFQELSADPAKYESN